MLPTPYYQDDFVTLYCGNTYEIMPLMIAAGIMVDHTLTDPPYEKEAHKNQIRQTSFNTDHLANRKVHGGGGKITIGEIPFDPITDEERDLAGRCFAKLTRRWVLVFSQIEAAMLWKASMLLELGSRSKKKTLLKYIRTQIWDKTDAMPQFSGDGPAQGYEAIVTMHRNERKRWNGGGRKGVYYHSKASRGNGKNPHPSTKPVPLLAELITLFTDPHELILDGFVGAGNTGVAAKIHNRRAILIEQSEEYCAIAANELRLTQPQILIPARTVRPVQEVFL